MTKTFAALTAASLTLVAMPAAAQDWQGFYFGGFGGAQSQSEEEGERILFDTNLDGNFGDTVNTAPPAANAFSPGFCDGSPNANNAAAGCSDDEDYAGEVGLRAGYDLQFGSLVIGGLVEGSLANVEDNVAAFSITPANYAFQRELQNLVAARLRVGLAVGRFLPYVTAGYAVGEVEDSFSTSNGANSFQRVDLIGTPAVTFNPLGKEVDADGYQFGAGIETKVSDRISVGVEYVYTDLEVDNPTVIRTGPGTAAATNPFLIVNAAGTNQRRSSDSMELHGFRITAAVRF